jgi:hypothetical protein
VKDPYQNFVHVFYLVWRCGMGFVFQGRGINSCKPISVPREKHFAKNALEKNVKLKSLTLFPDDSRDQGKHSEKLSDLTGQVNLMFNTALSKGHPVPAPNHLWQH